MFPYIYGIFCFASKKVRERASWKKKLVLHNKNASPTFFDNVYKKIKVLNIMEKNKDCINYFGFWKPYFSSFFLSIYRFFFLTYFLI